MVGSRGFFGGVLGQYGFVSARVYRPRVATPAWPADQITVRRTNPGRGRSRSPVRHKLSVQRLAGIPRAPVRVLSNEVKTRA